MKLVHRLIRKMGYVKPVGTHDMEPEFESMYQKVKEYSKLTRERHYANFKAIEYIVNHGIEGDVVEGGAGTVVRQR